MVAAMLTVGIPLVKTENGFVLISSTNLRQLVLFVLQEEITLLKREVDDKYV